VFCLHRIYLRLKTPMQPVPENIHENHLTVATCNTSHSPFPYLSRILRPHGRNHCLNSLNDDVANDTLLHSCMAAPLGLAYVVRCLCRFFLLSHDLLRRVAQAVGCWYKTARGCSAVGLMPCYRVIDYGPAVSRPLHCEPPVNLREELEPAPSRPHH